MPASKRLAADSQLDSSHPCAGILRKDLSMRPSAEQHRCCPYRSACNNMPFTSFDAPSTSLLAPPQPTRDAVTRHPRRKHLVLYRAAQETRERPAARCDIDHAFLLVVFSLFFVVCWSFFGFVFVVVFFV